MTMRFYVGVFANFKFGRFVFVTVRNKTESVCELCAAKKIIKGISKWN